MINTLFTLAALLDQGPLPTTEANQDTLTEILNLVFVTVGGLAVLMIVIAGLRMILSGDEPTKVAESRRMILYAIIGLILAGSAWAIVNVVLNHTS